MLGRLHPLLIHFPIALAIVAIVAEGLAIATDDRRWQIVAVANIRAAAAFGCVAAIAGWRLATQPGVEASALLEWHRWLGTLGVAVTVTAAIATSGADGRTPVHLWAYRIALASAAALVAITAHFGGLMVWGADFLRP